MTATEEKQNDHDLLIKLGEQIKFVRDDIRELKDGTKDRLDKAEERIKELEEWRKIHSQQNKDDLKNSKAYLAFLIGIGILIFGILLWHITGYHI